jgi:hypothetical protein
LNPVSHSKKVATIYFGNLFYCRKSNPFFRINIYYCI